MLKTETSVTNSVSSVSHLDKEIDSKDIGPKSKNKKDSDKKLEAKDEINQLLKKALKNAKNYSYKVAQKYHFIEAYLKTNKKDVDEYL